MAPSFLSKLFKKKDKAVSQQSLPNTSSAAAPQTTASTSTMSKPTIVLVPGAWHLPKGYALLTQALEDRGYPVTPVSLPANGSNPTQTSWDPDVSAVRSAVVAAADKGLDVYILMHSYGGFPGSEAAKGLDKASREKEGKKGGVVKMVYMTAFAVAEGVTLEMAVGGTLPAWIKPHEEQQGNTIATESERVFYNDLSEADKLKYKGELVTHSVQTMRIPVTYAAWKHIPSVYIICTKDNAIPLSAQQQMSQQPTDAGWDVHTLEASHSPMLSMPGDVAQIVDKISQGSK